MPTAPNPSPPPAGTAWPERSLARGLDRVLAAHAALREARREFDGLPGAATLLDAEVILEVWLGARGVAVEAGF